MAENIGAEREIFDQIVTGWRGRKSARVSRSPHEYAAIRNKKGQRITVDLYILVDDEGLLLNQRVAKLRAKNKRDWALVYVMFRQSLMKQYLEEMAKGTAQANLSPIETANMEVSLPPIKTLELFSEVATPLLERVLFNKSQARTLEKLRDILLPKLMSGEVRVEF